MVASLLLAVLALGGAAVMYQTGGGIQVQGNNRVALELINNLLERQKERSYSAMDFALMDDFTTNITVNGITFGIAVSVSSSTNMVGKDVKIETTYREQTIAVSSSLIPPIGIE